MVRHSEMSATQLQLNLLEGVVDQRQFTIHESDVFKNGEVRLDVSIIGSHLLIYRAGNVKVSEVLTSTLVEHPFKSEWAHIIHTGHVYTTKCIRTAWVVADQIAEYSLFVEIMDHPDMKKISSLHASFPFCLFHESVSRSDALSSTLSFIYARERHNGMEVHTFHGYPGEEKMIATRSTLSLHQECACEGIE